MRQRSSYPKPFKAQVVQECLQPGATVSSVAINHGINANVMRAGTETALARVIAVFGAAKPHCAYLFANRRANRMKVLVHDGVGVWLAARRLNQGKFHWPGIRHGCEVELDSEQLQALVLGLPWQRVGAGGVISML
ncbi:IS66 family insertion sequence element accessory protein TnpB [Pseudomonas alloputida]|uniref:IS66 family insertion sequence element accessory protein TnpB n=1 Tax=Pseudomonas alloputida TaxID=1940621 RepID=UPI0032ED3CBB